MRHSTYRAYKRGEKKVAVCSWQLAVGRGDPSLRIGMTKGSGSG